MILRWTDSEECKSRKAHSSLQFHLNTGLEQCYPPVWCHMPAIFSNQFLIMLHAFVLHYWWFGFVHLLYLWAQWSFSPANSFCWCQSLPTSSPCPPHPIHTKQWWGKFKSKKSNTVGCNRKNPQFTRSHKDMMTRQICLTRAIIGMVQVDGSLFYLIICPSECHPPCCVSHLTATGHLDNQCKCYDLSLHISTYLEQRHATAVWNGLLKKYTISFLSI